MVGVNTVICDDPLLTCRLKDGKNPVRIICDSYLRTPLESRIIQTADSVKTIIATCSKDEGRKEVYRSKYCTILEVGQKENSIDLSELMIALGKMNIDSILLEGGGTLNWGALYQRIVDEMQVYIAPKVFGGMTNTPVAGIGVDFPNQAFVLKESNVSQIGNDFLIESEVKYPCLQES
jgi:diaminohydroxyphosphoribosylaminopyrimidine deaminase/5-amino-6-(5-phosphoribosylamino)uracil reductase